MKIKLPERTNNIMMHFTNNGVEKEITDNSLVKKNGNNIMPSEDLEWEAGELEREKQEAIATQECKAEELRILKMMFGEKVKYTGDYHHYRVFDCIDLEIIPQYDDDTEINHKLKDEVKYLNIGYIYTHATS